MEFNVSSYYDGDENNQTKNHLNSTAVDQDADGKENSKKEWKLSPITAEEPRSSIFKDRHVHVSSNGSKSMKHDFKSPLKLANRSDDISGYESKSTVDGESSSMRADNQVSSLSLSAELSSFIANKSLNPFDSILLNSLHKKVTFSPGFVFSKESCSSQQEGEKFQWSVEQLAILKPAHITEDEIAANQFHSPIPEEVEEKIQEALNEYWSKNPTYIPSPDGPRYVHIPQRDGNITTVLCDPDGGSSENPIEKSHHSTPSLCTLIRKKEAAKMAYATSSPKQRPRRNIKQLRSCNSQTELTIPPKMNIDFRKILGESFIYNENPEEEDNGEVFDVSMCSNISTRRRLFTNSNEDEDANSSMLSSCEHLNDSQQFNDSLSPVRRNDDDDEEEEAIIEADESSVAGKSQIAINISILNDCMMHSLSHVEEEDEENLEENHELEENRVFVDSSQKNEYELLDESCSSSHATPRREDLDWTPQRLSQQNPQRTPHFRKFMFEMSPINPSKRFCSTMPKFE